MTTFYYRAVGRDGRAVDGTLEAAGPELASRQLRARGLTLLSIRAEGAGGALGRSRGRPPSRQDVLSMTTELAVLLRAGLPLDRSLKVLIDMAVVPSMAALLGDVLKSVKDGNALSAALQPYEALFGRFYLSMVRSGEASGEMSNVLDRLVEHLQAAKANRDAVISALIYPAILLVVACSRCRDAGVRCPPVRVPVQRHGRGAARADAHGDRRRGLFAGLVLLLLVGRRCVFSRAALAEQ
jgi:general secretion pathway protein F